MLFAGSSTNRCSRYNDVMPLDRSPVDSVPLEWVSHGPLPIQAMQPWLSTPRTRLLLEIRQLRNIGVHENMKYVEYGTA